MNRTLHALVGIATLIMILGLAPTPIEAAPDLTGTWEGTADCRVFNGGDVRVVFDDDIAITQSHTTVYLRSLRFDAETFYRGLVMESAAYPETRGRAAIAACGTTRGGRINGPVAISELMNMAVSTPGQGWSELSATTVFFLANGAAFGFGEGPVVGTCQVKYVRVSPVDPGIGNCPP